MINLTSKQALIFASTLVSGKLPNTKDYYSGILSTLPVSL